MAEVRYYNITPQSLNENFKGIFDVLNECYTKIEELNSIDTKIKEVEKQIEEISSKLSSKNIWINTINDKIKPFEERYLIINSNYQDSSGKFNLIKNNFDSINNKYNELKIDKLKTAFEQFNTDYSKLLEENNSFIESSLTVNNLSTLRSSELDDINTRITTFTNIGTNFINRKGIRTTNNFITGDAGVFGKINGLNGVITGETGVFGKISGLNGIITGDTGFKAIRAQISGVNNNITGEEGVFGKISGLNGVITGNTGFGGISSTLTTMGNNITGITQTVNTISGQTSGLTGNFDEVYTNLGSILSGVTVVNTNIKISNSDNTGLTSFNGVLVQNGSVLPTVPNNFVGNHWSDMSNIGNPQKPTFSKP